VWPTIWRLLEGKTVVIYNEGFDGRMLYQSAHPYRLVLPDFDSVCAMQKFAVFYGETHHYYGTYTWQKLETACRCLEISLEAAHTASADARVTALVIQALAAKARLELPIGFKLPVDVPCAGGCKQVVKECKESHERRKERGSSTGANTHTTEREAQNHRAGGFVPLNDFSPVLYFGTKTP